MTFEAILRKTINQAGIYVPDEQLSNLALFGQELIKWNRKINLTAINSAEEIAIKHFVDALHLRLVPGPNTKLLDVGSGAGIPAIPLKIIRPDLDITSVDAVGKKIHFQRHVARLLGLSGFSAIHARVERLYASHGGVFDIVVSRAFSNLAHFIELVEPLLKYDGALVAMKGPAVQGEIEAAHSVLEQRRLAISSIATFDLPNSYGERRLITIKRI